MAPFLFKLAAMTPEIASHFYGFQGEKFVCNWRNLYMLWHPGIS